MSMKVIVFRNMAPCIVGVDVSKVSTASIIRVIIVMETVCNSDMSIYFNETTQCHILKGCHLYFRSESYQEDPISYLIFSCISSATPPILSRLVCQ
jgi:hypothetical protein